MCSAHQPEFFEGRKRFCSASAEDQHKGGERGVEIQHAIPNTNTNINTNRKTNTCTKDQHKEVERLQHAMLSFELLPCEICRILYNSAFHEITSTSAFRLFHILYDDMWNWTITKVCRYKWLNEIVKGDY